MVAPEKYEGKLKIDRPIFLWNVWSDFFLDRWRRSGVIRMSAAVARALIALKSDNPCYVPSASKHLAGGYMLGGIYKQNSLVDLADFAPNVPCGERTCVLRMLGSREALLRTVFACSDWGLSPLAFAQIGRITVCFIELKFRKTYFTDVST